VRWTNRDLQRFERQFESFMSAIVPVLGRSERRTAAIRYVEGLLMEGQRKSIEPLAARLGVDGQSLQQFVSDSPWEEEEVWSSIRREIVAHIEPFESWIVDETGWLKQGEHSVGVARQYCGAAGKKANCQVNVQLAVSNGAVAAPIGARLFLPESWILDTKRRDKAGVPKELGYATKAQIALQLIDQALVDEVQQAPVLGDSIYGDSWHFRQGLRERGLEFFLQVSANLHQGWAEPIRTVKSRTKTHPHPDAPPAQSLEQLIAGLKPQQFRPASWKVTDGSSKKTRLAWLKVYLSRALFYHAKEPEAVWLVVDWPPEAPEPYNVYLAHLHRTPSTARCLRLSRSRWQIEQYFQRSKDALGLDHYEGRFWRGFHHHLALSALAYLFILTCWLRSKKNFFSDVGADAPLDSATLAETHRLLPILSSQV
jgi:SRSO17 transposase